MLLNRETPVIILFLSISMIHWPFIFEHSDISNRYTRYLLVILILLLIVSKIRTFKFDEILIFGIIFFTALLQSFANSLTFENLVYFYSKILFIFLFWVYIKQKSIIDLPYLKYWKIFSSIIFIFSILTFILHSFTNIQTDYFGIDQIINPKRVSYSYPSIFGITQEIYYRFGVTGSLHRVTSYFNEPGDLSFFCIVSLIIIKNINNGTIFSFNNNQKIYTFLCILTGLLCFSATFYIILFILFINDLRKSFSLFGILIILLGLISIFYIENIIFEIFNFFEGTSFTNRLDRFQCGIEYLVNANIEQIFLGYGVIEKPCLIYNPKLEYMQTAGFSSGFNIVGVQYGIIALFLSIGLSFLFLKKNLLDLFIYLLCYLALSWSLQYIFLFGIIVTHISNKYRNIKIK